MNDERKLIQLFTEFGIGFTTDKDSTGGTMLTCMEGGKRVDGYNSFYTMFEFDKDGKFMQMGAWE